MSTEEFDKPIPKGTRIPEGLQLAIARLAKITVEQGLDPVQVLTRIMRFIEAWNSLTPEQRQAVRAELRRPRDPRVGVRKPRRQDGQHRV